MIGGGVEGGEGEGVVVVSGIEVGGVVCGDMVCGGGEGEVRGRRGGGEDDN